MKFWAVVSITLLCVACGKIAPENVRDPATTHVTDSVQSPPAKGGIPVPPGVRSNLGITFVTVEKRHVSATRRIPGEFELLPTARHEYRAMVAGHARIVVRQFDHVAAGDVLFTLDSPEWREIQHEMVEAEGEIARAKAALDVTQTRRDETASAANLQQERIQNLKKAGIRKADLETETAALVKSLDRLTAEIAVSEITLDEAREHYESRLNILSAITGYKVGDLKEQSNAIPLWRSLGALEIRATHEGTVETLAVNEGGWVNAGDLAVVTIDTSQIRFHAHAPQADIALFKEGQEGLIVPPQGSSVALQEGLNATIQLGLTAHPETRTISVFAKPTALAPWAKAGVAGLLEIDTGTPSQPRWAIPVASIVQDGLDMVFFRRDPSDPDRVFRVIADLGQSDGRWTELKSGVKEGDEVVLEGVYALKLAGAAQQAPQGYHYHADGSLHVNH